MPQQKESKKVARLEARVPTAIHALLQKAANLQGRSLSDFVVSAARQAAEEAIANLGAIQLSVADQERFAAALLAPPPIAPALTRAFEAERELIDPP